MTVPRPAHVLVGVGNQCSVSALDFAVLEAARSGCGVHLLHVVRPGLPGEPMTVDAYDLRAAGRRVLADAVKHCVVVAPRGMAVTSELRVGSVVACLVGSAESRARLVVLERRDLSGLRRAVTRRVTSGVAAHSRVPVVSVPAGWTPSRKAHATVPVEGDASARRVPPPPPTVTIGVDVPDRSLEVLRLGLAEARQRRAVVHLVHTWSLPESADLVLTPAQEQAWTDSAVSQIKSSLAESHEDLHGLSIDIDVRRGHAADVLVAAANHSDIVVLGRHDPAVPLGSHLGPVARAVLREATGPVLLADPRPSIFWRGRRGHGSPESALTQR